VKEWKSTSLTELEIRKNKNWRELWRDKKNNAIKRG